MTKSVDLREAMSEDMGPASKANDEQLKNKGFGEASVSPTGSLRFNNGKPEVTQLSPEFILALSELMTKSAAKYGKLNWAYGQQFSTPMDSCMRHLLKFQQGEDLDEESNMDHLIHAAANIMILYHSYKNHKELDDRPEEFKK